MLSPNHSHSTALKRAKKIMVSKYTLLCVTMTTICLVVRYNRRAFVAHILCVAYVSITALIKVNSLYGKFKNKRETFFNVVVATASIHSLFPILGLFYGVVMYIHLFFCFFIHIAHFTQCYYVFKDNRVRDHEYMVVLVIVSVLEFLSNYFYMFPSGLTEHEFVLILIMTELAALMISVLHLKIHDTGLVYASSIHDGVSISYNKSDGRRAASYYADVRLGNDAMVVSEGGGRGRGSDFSFNTPINSQIWRPARPLPSKEGVMAVLSVPAANGVMAATTATEATTTTTTTTMTMTTTVSTRSDADEVILDNQKKKQSSTVGENEAQTTLLGAEEVAAVEGESREAGEKQLRTLGKGVTNTDGVTAATPASVSAEPDCITDVASLSSSSRFGRKEGGDDNDNDKDNDNGGGGRERGLFAALSMTIKTKPPAASHKSPAPRDHLFSRPSVSPREPKPEQSLLLAKLCTFFEPKPLLDTSPHNQQSAMHDSKNYSAVAHAKGEARAILIDVNETQWQDMFFRLSSNRLILLALVEGATVMELFVQCEYGFFLIVSVVYYAGLMLKCAVKAEPRQSDRSVLLPVGIVLVYFSTLSAMVMSGVLADDITIPITIASTVLLIANISWCRIRRIKLRPNTLAIYNVPVHVFITNACIICTHITFLAAPPLRHGHKHGLVTVLVCISLAWMMVASTSYF